MTNQKQTKRLALDADIDAEMHRGDELLEKLLQRQQVDNQFFQCLEHMKRTKTIVQALTDDELSEKINGNGKQKLKTN